MIRPGIGLAISLVAVCLPGCANVNGEAPGRLDKLASSGQEVRIFYAYAVNPDCSSVGQTVVKARSGPSHGQIRIVRASMFPSYPHSNIRHLCNSRRVDGTEVWYRSFPNYTGKDQAVLSTYFPNGAVNGSDTVDITIE